MNKIKILTRLKFVEQYLYDSSEGVTPHAYQFDKINLNDDICSMRVISSDGYDLVSEDEYIWGNFVDFLRRNNVSFEGAL